jgi:uncharacterized protein YndB with AHSA1/START domain
MTTPITTTTETTKQVYRIFIRSTPEQIWEAIVNPEFTQRYFHGARITVTPDAYRSIGTDGSTWGDAEVLEFDPPRRLVHGWQSLYDPDLADEPVSRVTWDIEPRDDDVCLLTVTHDQLEDAPGTAASVSGVGWMGVISSLKSLLETGKAL